MLRMIRIIPIPSLQLFPNLVVETGKAADDDVWGWDGMGAEHMFSKQDGEREGKTEVCGTFQMQICHERTLEEGKEEREGGRGYRLCKCYRAMLRYLTKKTFTEPWKSVRQLPPKSSAVSFLACGKI